MSSPILPLPTARARRVGHITLVLFKLHMLILLKDNGYGYAASTALPSDLAINNAASYAFYANAIYVGC